MPSEKNHQKLKNITMDSASQRACSPSHLSEVSDSNNQLNMGFIADGSKLTPSELSHQQQSLLSAISHQQLSMSQPLLSHLGMGLDSWGSEHESAIFPKRRKRILINEEQEVEHMTKKRLNSKMKILTVSAKPPGNCKQEPRKLRSKKQEPQSEDIDDIRLLLRQMEGKTRRL